MYCVLFGSKGLTSHAIQCFCFLFSDNLGSFDCQASLEFGRRGMKLLLNGYEYYRNGTVRWRCSQYKHSCKVRVMAVEINGKMMAKITTNVKHNHPKMKNWVRILGNYIMRTDNGHYKWVFQICLDFFTRVNTENSEKGLIIVLLVNRKRPCKEIAKTAGKLPLNCILYCSVLWLDEFGAQNNEFSNKKKLLRPFLKTSFQCAHIGNILRNLCRFLFINSFSVQ